MIPFVQSVYRIPQAGSIRPSPGELLPLCVWGYRGHRQVIGEKHTIAVFPTVGGQTEKSIPQQEQSPVDPGPVSAVKTVQHRVLRSVESDGVDHSEGVVRYSIAGRGAVEHISHQNHAYEGTTILFS